MQGVFDILPCSEEAHCLNSMRNIGIGSGKCGICRLSPGDNAGAKVSYWKPKVHGMKHPGAEAEKKQKKQADLQARREARLAVDSSKRKLLTKASKAEKQTERNIIRSTRNSGRTNKDGDHVAAGNITLDTKLQTKRENPVVLMHELQKVGEDARRAGNSMGALVIRNTHGLGVVVMTEQDFGRIIAQLR